MTLSELTDVIPKGEEIIIRVLYRTKPVYEGTLRDAVYNDLKGLINCPVACVSTEENKIFITLNKILKEIEC